MIWLPEPRNQLILRGTCFGTVWQAQAIFFGPAKSSIQIDKRRFYFRGYFSFWISGDTRDFRGHSCISEDMKILCACPEENSEPGRRLLGRYTLRNPSQETYRELLLNGFRRSHLLASCPQKCISEDILSSELAGAGAALAQGTRERPRSPTCHQARPEGSGPASNTQKSCGWYFRGQNLHFRGHP